MRKIILLILSMLFALSCSVVYADAPNPFGGPRHRLPPQRPAAFSACIDNIRIVDEHPTTLDIVLDYRVFQGTGLRCKIVNMRSGAICLDASHLDTKGSYSFTIPSPAEGESCEYSVVYTPFTNLVNTSFGVKKIANPVYGEEQYASMGVRKFKDRVELAWK